MLKIVRAMYGARQVQYQREAERDLQLIEKLGLTQLPLCIAKTPRSLSGDPSQLGRPENFDITVRSLIVASGAGYIVPLVGDILRMPGLPPSPQAHRIDLVNGEVRGVSDR